MHTLLGALNDTPTLTTFTKHSPSATFFFEDVCVILVENMVMILFAIPFSHKTAPNYVMSNYPMRKTC